MDAFVRDVAAGRTELVSTGNGDAGAVALSADGRWAAFTSSATDLVPGSVFPNRDVYLRDRVDGTVRQVTVRPDGSFPRGPGPVSVAVSGDGRLVVFTSSSTDLAPSDADGSVGDLFVRDMSTGTTRWLGAGAPAGAEPGAVAVSADGRLVAVRYDDGSLQLVRTATGATSLLAPAGVLSPSAWSADGQRVVYSVPDALGRGRAVLRDLATGRVTDLRTPAGGSAGAVALSGDGRHAAYDWVPDGSENVRTYLVDLG